LQAEGRRGLLTVSCRLAAPARLDVVVHNLAGRQVAVLTADRQCAPGLVTLQAAARGLAGQPLPPGAYLVSVTARQPDGRRLSLTAPLLLR
jgi:hypothetical protein